MEQVLLKAISRDMKDRMTWNSQHGFTKGRSCLIIPVAFCNKVSVCADKGQSSGCCVPLARPLIYSLLWYPDNLTVEGCGLEKWRKKMGGKFPGALGSKDDSNADSSWCPSGILTGLNTV